MVYQKISFRHLLAFALVGGVLINVAFAAVGDGGSKCADASCTPAPVGVQCEPKYERDDGCCPVWHCNNGQTAYGVSRSSASGSSFSFSTGGMNGGATPLANPLANIFANLFG